MLRLVFFAVIAIAMIVVDEGTARAQPPPQDLMARLGAYAERFETLRKRASYAVEGELDSVDSHGHASSTIPRHGGAPSVTGRATELRT